MLCLPLIILITGSYVHTCYAGMIKTQDRRAAAGIHSSRCDGQSGCLGGGGMVESDPCHPCGDGDFRLLRTLLVCCQFYASLLAAADANTSTAASYNPPYKTNMSAIAAGKKRNSTLASKMDPALLAKFDKALEADTDSQCELFMKSFIFNLGDDWKEVVRLSSEFNKFLADGGNENDCSCIQASHFLQKNGKTRTGIQRKEELRDVDLNFDDRISFLEYCLLHYKVMILTAYYKRIGVPCPHDLSSDGVGITGVGGELLDELFYMPAGLPPALQRALDEFFSMKRAKEAKIKTLTAKALLPGVKGLTAKNEIAQLNTRNQTDMNRLEITLNAAKRKAMKKSGGETAAEALSKLKVSEEEKAQAERAKSRAALRAKMAMFNGGATPAVSNLGSNERRVPAFLRKSQAKAAEQGQ